MKLLNKESIVLIILGHYACIWNIWLFSCLFFLFLASQKAFHRIIERIHEYAVVNRRLSTRVLAAKTMVSVRRDVLYFVFFPSEEHFADIQVVAIIGLFRQFVDKVSLEINVIVDSFYFCLFSKIILKKTHWMIARCYWRCRTISMPIPSSPRSFLYVDRFKEDKSMFNPTKPPSKSCYNRASPNHLQCGITLITHHVIYQMVNIQIWWLW